MTKQEGPIGSINFGRRAEWIKLYKERATYSQEYHNLAERHERLMRSLNEQQQGNMQRALGMLAAPMPLQQGKFLADLDAFDGYLAQQADQARAIAGNIKDASIDFAVEQLNLDNAAAANDINYNAVHKQLREKERAIGQQCTGDVPLYIARAIGNAYPAPLEDVWTDVRGAIEAFRFVTEETRPDVTLGRGVKRQWSTDALGHIVLDVQRIQTVQIALSPAPTVTAAAFDRLDTLAVVGDPPVPTDENLTFANGTWTRAALDHMKAVEPPESGLLIDQR